MAWPSTPQCSHSWSLFEDVHLDVDVLPLFWALLFHVLRPSQVQHITPWPYFVEKDGEGLVCAPFWSPLAFPLSGAIDSSFLESLWVVMMTSSLPTSTKKNPQFILSTMWNAYQCGMTFMISNESRFYHHLHILVLFGLDMYNCTN